MGYGFIGSGGRAGKPVLAHRVSWELNKGAIPDGKIIMHICDNPPCVNPDHLRLGSRRENQKDMINKGRGGGQFISDETLPWSRYGSKEAIKAYHRAYRAKRKAFSNLRSA